MIHLVVVRNPFDVKQKDIREKKYKKGAPICAYFKERGAWLYSIDGIIAGRRSVPQDGAYVVVVPRVQKKMFGLILSIGLSFLTAGIASGTILGGLSMGWRMVTALAIGMIGGAIVSKLNRPHIDMSNGTEQSQTYGWGGTATLTGQGHPLAITYGSMKSGGVLLSRHIISDGARQYLHLLYCAGEGELSEIRNIRINENPIENYKDVQVDIRLGTNDQTVIPNFADSYADQPLNYELTETWATHEVQGNQCTGIELTVALPNGLYYSNDQGGMSSTSLTLEAECRIVGGTEPWIPLPLANTTGTEAFLAQKGAVWVKSIGGGAIEERSYRGVIGEATNKAIYRVYRFENLPAGRYTVRMRCVSKDGSSIRHVNRVYWSQLTQIVYDDFVHPGKALIGIRALATEQLSGNDPAVSWVQERKTVYVLHPYRTQYEGQHADNPAWACYDILHQCRKIGGRYIVRGEPAERLSYDMFRAWAEQCAAKGYTFNYIYDSAMQVWEALRYPEAVGRGKVIMQGTRFTCVYDYAAQPTQLFTVGNIKQDSFKEEFQGTQGRANVVEISFMNAAKNYERDVLPVFSDDYDVSEALATPTQIELMGCTDAKQAYAHGKHALRANKYELRTCTFEAYVDAIASTLGDVILLQHDVTNWGNGGRVAAVNGTAVTLDREVTMAAGKRYRLMVRNSSTDALHTYDVKSVDGAVVTLAQADGIVAGDLYTYGEATKEAKPFRILSISKGMTEQTRKIICMEYYPELYASDDSDVPIIDYTTGSDVLTVQNLIVSTDIKTQPDGTTLYDLAISWRLPRGAVAKQIKVEYKREGETGYTTQGVYDGSATSTVVAGVAAAMRYDVRVTCYNDLGLAGGTAAQAVYTAPKSVSPSKVKEFYFELDERTNLLLHLFWEPVPEKNIIGYLIQEDTGYETLVPSGNSCDFFARSYGRYRLGISAVNRMDQKSESVYYESDVYPVNETNDVPGTPQSGEVRLQGRSIIVAWDAVVNTYVDFYEVRTNDAVGQKTGLLAKTGDIQTAVSLTVRTGSLLVYAHNPEKGYGQPLSIHYDFPTPRVPTVFIERTLQGFNVIYYGDTENIIGARVRIQDSYGAATLFEATNGVVSFAGKAGIYDVQVALFDAFGEGEWSPPHEATIKAKIDKAAIEGLTITQQDLDAVLNKQLQDLATEAAAASTAAGQANVAARLAQTTADGVRDLANDAKRDAKDAREVADRTVVQVRQTQDSISSIVARLSGNPQNSGYSAITQLYNGLQLKVNQGELTSAFNQTRDSISSIVAKLSGNPQNSGYSAITQIYNGLQLKVNQGDVVSAINVSPWGVRIDGRLLHITGNTQIDGSIIANHMIQAGAVTADKLSVGSLSAVCATIGNLRTKASGARTEIKDNLIEVFDENNQTRVRIGVF